MFKIDKSGRGWDVAISPYVQLIVNKNRQLLRGNENSGSRHTPLKNSDMRIYNALKCTAKNIPIYLAFLLETRVRRATAGIRSARSADTLQAARASQPRGTARS